jgi:hypothetical protein
MGSGVMIYITSFIMIVPGIQKLMRGAFVFISNVGRRTDWIVQYVYGHSNGFEGTALMYGNRDVLV